MNTHKTNVIVSRESTKMDTTTKYKPQTFAELLPSLEGIISKDLMQMITAKKQPRQTMAQSSTSEKPYKPLTIAEMGAEIMVFRGKSSETAANRSAATSTHKKKWNSSAKIDKKITHTAYGQMKNNPVRKVLNFQSKSKAITPRLIKTITPKFPNKEYKAKKSLLPHIEKGNNVRISGVFNIPETPINQRPNKQFNNRRSIKYNQDPTSKKLITPIRPVEKKTPLVPDTPLTDLSCDDSFLQKEKEINDIEEKVNALVEQSLENIADVSPPVSTPFKDYRNVTEFFNNSSGIDNSNALSDDTIMCFDKQSTSKEIGRRDESVIVSLCDMVQKASINPTKTNTHIDELLEAKKRTVKTLQFIENIKQDQLRNLEHIEKLINEQKQQTTSNDMDKTVVKDTLKVIKKEISSPKKSPTLQKTPSVIKNSPTYKIPKKSSCLREKVFHKSMPTVTLSPSRGMGSRAKSVYMEMKEHMNFLNTPVVKQKNLAVPDTPARTSHNLQKQLDKLYDESS